MQGMNGPAYHPTLGCRVGAHGHGCPPVLGCKGCVVTLCAGMQRRCTPPYSLPRFHAAERQHDPAGPPGMQRYGGDTARSPLPAVTQRASGSSERCRGGEGGHSAAGRGWRLCPPPLRSVPARHHVPLTVPEHAQLPLRLPLRLGLGLRLRLGLGLPREDAEPLSSGGGGPTAARPAR